MGFLEHIHSPDDLKKIRPESLPEVCAELRAFLINCITQNGGHFSANLGTVELTVALHYVFDTPNDQLIWDVGHQAYGHKVLTGRRSKLASIRSKNGISGFPKRDESLFDAFGTGHSSTSISAALGMAIADKLSGNNRAHIAVIGDGSLSAGMAWEALNNAAQSNTRLIIVINDNRMGIDPNTGALGSYLDGLQNGEPNFFSQLGFEYVGPDDGHQIHHLIEQATYLKSCRHPVIWHIRTVKGKGYAPAEAEQTKWHAVKYVKIRDEESIPETRFQDVFGDTLVELAEQNTKVVGITPAMPSGCSMNNLMQRFPDRAFDVGIAEQHAVTVAAGMAANGLIPFCNIYSSFLQRAYDQVIHDVCLQNLPVIFCLDRAGVVGEDGATHHGLYDLAFLRPIPNLEILCPSGADELSSAMRYAVEHRQGPVAIRYPKGDASNVKGTTSTFAPGSYSILKEGKSAVILAAGPMALVAQQALDGTDCTLIDIRFIKPLNHELMKDIVHRYHIVITVEDGCRDGGFGSAVLEQLSDLGYTGKVHRMGFPDEFIEHATREELLTEFGLDQTGIRNAVDQLINPSI
ncbi:MAG: 1-deoxy-D-xylulose-5-phosphate synthase [Bacteroidetes bacterium]|nr:1-deoxy-D-xylulose-5-phosphate synthase [Bacteroidota bacterium]